MTDITDKNDTIEYTQNKKGDYSKKMTNTMLEATYNAMLANKDTSIADLTVESLEVLMRLERKQFLAEEARQTRSNKGNGFYERFVNALNHRMHIHVPRDRHGQFKPFALEILKKESELLDSFALKLYSKGLSARDISSLLTEVYGLRYSPAKISQLVKEFEPYRRAWQKRSLARAYHMIMIDAIHINVRRDTVEKEAIYVIMGLNMDFTREILGIYAIPRESASGWNTIFADIAQRGCDNVGLICCDELSGIETAIYDNFPRARIQFCLLHKLRALYLIVRSNLKKQITSEMWEVFAIDNTTDTEETVHARLEQFLERWGKLYPSIHAKFPERKRTHYMSYLVYPVHVRRMLYTTNWIERLNKEVRKVTHHANLYPHVDSLVNAVFMVAWHMEEKVYRYPITTFYNAKEAMEELLQGRRRDTG